MCIDITSAQRVSAAGQAYHLHPQQQQLIHTQQTHVAAPMPSPEPCNVARIQIVHDVVAV